MLTDKKIKPHYKVKYEIAQSRKGCRSQSTW